MASTFPLKPILTLLVNHALLLPNPVREGLPTIHPECFKDSATGAPSANGNAGKFGDIYEGLR